MTRKQVRSTLDALWNADASIGRSAVLPFGKEPTAPMVVVIEYLPNAHVDAHHHDTDYLSIVIRGSMIVSNHPESVGSVRSVTAGATYGPLEVGPDGCTVVDVFAERQGGVPRFAGTNSELSVVAESNLAAIVPLLSR